MKNLLIISSGGDSSGMNAAIRATVRSAIAQGLKVFGAENGFYGLINHKINPLTQASVANIIQRGGTILKTGRCPEFREKSVRDQCRAYLDKLNIDAIVILGGEGSFTGANLLAKESAGHGPKIIGIPCTIDNDIVGTEYCIGFDTARNNALEAIDKIRDTAFSHDRNFLIEVMGRLTGFLAVDVGIAGGAEVILIPEFPITTPELVKKIQRKNKKRQKLASIIVVAEANRPGYSIQLAKEIKSLSDINYKVCILGHTQRGGTPTALDRKIATIMGAKAVTAVLNGESGQMVSYVQDKIGLAPFPDPKNATRFFNDVELLRMNDMICEI